MRKNFLYLFIVVVILSMVLPSCAPTPVAPAELKVLRFNMAQGDIPTIDPSLAEDTSSTQVVELAYVGLTRQNEETLANEPGMASKWEASADGKVYTFHLRKDVPWVRYNPDSGKVEKVVDCDKKERMVTADDFYYGMMRTMDPAVASPYAFMFQFSVVGAKDYMEGKNKDPKSVGIKAVDPQTLEVTFINNAVFNPSLIGKWYAMAEPKWAIEGDTCSEAKKERWIEPGAYQSYGPYTLKEWVHDSKMVLIKNPFWPGADNIPVAKIDEISFAMLDDPSALAEYEAGNLETGINTVPLSDIDRIKSDPVLSKELSITPTLCTYYYGYNTQAPVVDDVRVRRALSMAIDRQSLIDNVTKGKQEPAQWFSRPGLVGSPSIDKFPDLGVKYNPEEAKKQLDEYLKEKNTTADKLDLTLMFNTNAGHQKIAEAIQSMWKKTLGLDVKLANQEWKVYLETTKDPKATPQIFRLGWCQDYADANNFLKDQAAVGGNNNPKGPGGGGYNWKNDKYEDLVVQAVVEQDAAKRTDLYAQAEKILVYEDAVMAPIYWYTRVSLTKPYVKRTYSQLGGQEHIEKWDIQKK